MSEENKNILENEESIENEKKADNMDEQTAEAAAPVEPVDGEETDAAEEVEAIEITEEAQATETEEVNYDALTEDAVEAEASADDDRADDMESADGADHFDSETDGGNMPLEWAAAAPIQQKQNKAGMIAVIAAVVIVIAAIALVSYMFLNRNPYNRKYIDVTGRTVQEVAEGAGMELSEFLEMYGLPADMPANTYESAAYYSIPAGTIAKMNMMDFATMKQVLSLPDEVTEDMTWGEVEDSLTVGQQVGEDGVEEFKAEYGLGDDVTADTKWGDIRKQVDKVSRKQRIESEKEEKKAIGGADESTDIDVTEGGEQEPAANDGSAGDAAANAPADGSAQQAPTDGSEQQAPENGAAVQ